MKIEVWSDVVCPFCYIGKRHLEKALENFPGREQVEVVFRSFELSPGASFEPGVSMTELLAAKYGMTLQQAEDANRSVTEQAARAGLTYHLDRVIPANTFNAHRLAQYADKEGKLDEMTEVLFKAYFTDLKDLNDAEQLADLAVQAGLNRDKAVSVLESEEFSSEVLADEQAAREIGVRGVPFFVLDHKFAVSGAQPVEVFTQALQKAAAEASPLVFVEDANAAPGGSCNDDACS
ncbi:DsbA family oxidoreductase [Paenibacillus sp. JSM ZJ436]|uniref:DsbA family oxidoreductase n=1 Tax=Paenibacillus sp. JSM ZJ436 TaxID=3376190 RepID=UPI0037A6D55B